MSYILPSKTKYDKFFPVFFSFSSQRVKYIHSYTEKKSVILLNWITVADKCTFAQNKWVLKNNSLPLPRISFVVCNTLLRKNA